MTRNAYPRIKTLGGLLAALSLVVLASACGGGDADQSDVESKLLQQMVLTEEDLPLGLVQISAFVSTNQDVAEAVSDPEAEAAKLEAWGRRLGYDVQFGPGPEAPPDSEIQGVQNTASLYATIGGAGGSFSSAATSARTTDWPSLYAGVSDLNVEEIERPDLADEHVWFRISGIEANGVRLVIDDQVAFRVKSVRSFLRVVTVFDADTPRNAYLDEVETWVRLVGDRIESVLAATES